MGPAPKEPQSYTFLAKTKRLMIDYAPNYQQTIDIQALINC
jgi:hypothetical protein